MAKELFAIDLNEWYTVLTNGEWFAGTKDKDHPSKLTHLQKASFQFAMIETPEGLRPKIVVLTYPWMGMETMVIPEGALWNAVAAYREPGIDWPSILGSTEKLKLQQRAQRSGIHLARH